MALKVKAKEQLIKVGKYAETYRYVMMPELYTALTQAGVLFGRHHVTVSARGILVKLQQLLYCFHFHRHSSCSFLNRKLIMPFWLTPLSRLTGKAQM